MNKKMLIFIMGIFVIGMASVAFARMETAEDRKNAFGKDNFTGPEFGNMTNMTYGQCVSVEASIKNTCFSDVKTSRDTCKANALNQTDIKTAEKSCRDTFKKDLKQCKTEFKKAKNGCKQFRHGLFGKSRGPEGQEPRLSYQ